MLHADTECICLTHLCSLSAAYQSKLVMCCSTSQSDSTASVWSAGKAFQPNLQDARFKSLLTSADFALDPTDPRFKQTDGSNSIAKAVATQRQHQAPAQPLSASATASGQATQQQQQQAAVQLADKTDPLQSGSDSAQMKAMVASLKRKSSKAGNTSKAAIAAASGQELTRKFKKQRLSKMGA